MSNEKKEKKAQVIDSLEEAFAKSNVIILTDYRGLPTEQMTVLRRKLQETGSEIRVVKNTLARFAVEKAGKQGLAGSLKGPMAVAFGYKDIVSPVKTLTEFTRDPAVSLKITGGFLGDRTLTPEEVASLATLPPREVLLARVLGQIKSPVTSLVSTLASPIRGVITVLQARIKQMEGEQQHAG